MVQKVAASKFSTGFSFIELLAVTAIIGILLAATASMTTFIMRMNASSVTQSEESQVVFQVSSSLSQPEICRMNFLAIFDAMKSVSSLDQKFYPHQSASPNLTELIVNSQVLIRKGDPLTSLPSLRIADIYVTELRKLNDTEQVLEGSGSTEVLGYTYAGVLRVEFDRGLYFLGGSKGKRDLAFQAKYSSVPKVGYPRCSVGSAGGGGSAFLPPPEQICMSLGGSWNSGACSLNQPPPNPAETCTALGGTWNNNSCQVVSALPSGSLVFPINGAERTAVPQGVQCGNGFVRSFGFDCISSGGYRDFEKLCRYLCVRQ